MTTLIMMGIVLFGVAGYRTLPVSDLPNVDFPTLQVQRQPARRQSGDHGGLRGHAAGAAVLHHPRPGFDDLHQFPRAPPASPCSSRSTARSMPPRRTCSPPSPPSLRRLPAGHAQSAHLPQGEPGRPAHPLPGAQLADAAALARGRVRRDADLAAHLHDQRRGAGERVWARRNTPCACSSIPTCWPRAASASTKCRPRWRSNNVNLPTGTLWGPRQAYTVQANGQLLNAAAFRPLIVAYRNGSPVRLEELGRVIDSVENDKVAGWFNNAALHHAAGAAAAGHQHRGSGGPHQGTAAQLPRADAAVGEPGHPLRPLRIHPRIRQRREVHPAADRRRWWSW